jgi:hypothetical protein
MPRRSSGAKLWWDRKREAWTIIDGRARHRTGCGAAEAGRAEQALRDYITGKHKPAAGPDPIIADVIATYAEEHIKHAIAGKHIQYDLRHLTKWWGTKLVSEISAGTCRAYVAHRNAGASARREMAFLNAAIGHWKAHHAPQMAVPKIVLPPAPEPRKNWITRDEAARFLWQARRTPHLARFFIIGWYTGSRRSVICGLKWSMIDFKTKIMGQGAGGRRTAGARHAAHPQTHQSDEHAAAAERPRGGIQGAGNVADNADAGLRPPPPGLAEGCVRNPLSVTVVLPTAQKTL